MKQLIVTADDFGLSENINQGIAKAHTDGIVTAASLLIHAPATEHAIILAKKNPSLQVGLHLGIVESFCLSKNSKLLTVNPYWDRDCLPRNWQEFLQRQFFLNTTEWREEFEMQINKFISIFGHIPFLNSTQHLHLLPGLQNIILSLCQKYRIPQIRNAKSLIFSNAFSRRPIQTGMCLVLSKFLAAEKVNGADYLLGIDEAGKLNKNSLLKLIEKIPAGVSELIVHPGMDEQNLRASLPETYHAFDWQTELDGLISGDVKKWILDRKIKLRHF